MNQSFSEKYFINPGIEYGIRSYNALKKGESYERIYTFELYVIKALITIYGEKSILLPYKFDNEKAFECNLMIYDLKENDMKSFINYMNEYYNFMHNYKSEVRATGLINEIEKLLMEMINRRSKKKEFSPEELNRFDDVFNPTGGDLQKLKALVSSDEGLIIKAWENNKETIINTQTHLMPVSPSLLSSELYNKYGYDIRTIASLKENEILEVNNAIEAEECKPVEPVIETKCKRHLALTSGSVIIDSLILMSVVATEIMLGTITSAALWG